jgi:hypothetical protein
MQIVDTLKILSLAEHADQLFNVVLTKLARPYYTAERDLPRR